MTPPRLHGGRAIWPCRLDQLGITHLFGVPGNHLGPFLSTLHDEDRRCEWVGTPTEGGAGQAADAYTRVKSADAQITLGEQGIGAVAVTYSVGAFNLLNAIGGAYAEHVPLIAINACPVVRAVAEPAGDRPAHLAHGPAPGEQPGRLPPGHRGRPGHLQPGPGPRPDRQRDHRLPVRAQAGLPGGHGGRLGRAVRRHRGPSDAARAARHREEPAHARQRGGRRRMCRRTRPARRQDPPSCGPARRSTASGSSDEFEKLVRETRIPFCTTVGAKSVVVRGHPGLLRRLQRQGQQSAGRRVFKDAGTAGSGWAPGRPRRTSAASSRSATTGWWPPTTGSVSAPRTSPMCSSPGSSPRCANAWWPSSGAAAFAADYFASAHGDGPRRPRQHRRLPGFPDRRSLPGRTLTYDSFFDRINALPRAQTTEPRASAATRSRWCPTPRSR